MTTLPQHIINDAISRALAEDLGRAGDITSQSVLPPSATATADLVVREAGVLAGMDLVVAAFKAVDPDISLQVLTQDGAFMDKGSVALKASGSAISILTAERVALNYLGHLSGIASLTRQFVDAVKGTKAAIACTRKTTPGLRALQKYAVRMGGGKNHRFGLDDAVLIKDNHIAVVGGVKAAVLAAKAHVGHLVKIEVEIDRLDQLSEALEAKADVIMLDNMSLADMREAVSRVNGQAVLEASGGVTLDTVRAIAETGVDVISAGFLTHSAKNLDVALDIVIEG